MLVSSKRIVRKANTAVRTMGGKNPACVSARMDTTAHTPMMPMSLSCQSHSVALDFKLSG